MQRSVGPAIIASVAVVAVVAGAASAGKGEARIAARVAAIRGKVPDRAARLAGQAADSHVADVMRHSEKGGHYVIMSDLHLGLGVQRAGGHAFEGPYHPREDFRKTQAFVRMVKRQAVKGRTTFVLGGDVADVWEHADMSGKPEEIRSAISNIVAGHPEEVKALAEAVVHHDARILYVRGNHDGQLVDEGLYRRHFVDEMIRVAGLAPAEAQTFRSRLAWTGTLGSLAGGRIVVMHGDLQDPANNWRHMDNPRDHEFRLQENLGSRIVSKFYRDVESKDALVDNRNSATKGVLKATFSSRRQMARSIGLVWTLLQGSRKPNAAERQAVAMDDRETVLSWLDRTGFGEQMNAALPQEQRRSNEQWAMQLQTIYGRAPKPIHERLTSRFRLLNLGKAFVVGPRAMKEMARYEGELLGMLTDLPAVRFVVWGHDHKESAVLGQKDGKGLVGHFNTGSWTRVDGEWRLNVVVADTDERGEVASMKLHRTNDAGELVAHEASQKDKPLPPGWKPLK